jgi:hypothetical protein
VRLSVSHIHPLPPPMAPPPILLQSLSWPPLPTHGQLLSVCGQRRPWFAMVKDAAKCSLDQLCLFVCLFVSFLLKLMRCNALT